MYSEKIINKLIIKFKNETTLDEEYIRRSILYFFSIKESNQIPNKDITTYSFNNLRDTLIHFKPKRQKCGTISDKENDPNLLLSSGDIKIYHAKNKNSSIKYGNGYTFCISARSNENLFNHYCVEMENTIYFVFNKSYSKRKNNKGLYSEPLHLTVILINKNSKNLPIIYDANDIKLDFKKNADIIKDFQDILIYRPPDNEDSYNRSIDNTYQNKIVRLSSLHNIAPLIHDITSAIETINLYYGKNVTIFGFSFDPEQIHYSHITTNKSYMIPMRKIQMVERIHGKKNLEKNLKMVVTHIMDSQNTIDLMNSLKNIVDDYKNDLLKYILL